MEQSARNRQEDPKQGLLQTRELYEYILDTSVYPREHAPLKELRHVTANHPSYTKTTASDSGQLIAMFLNIAKAKNTIEIGVFTGYSLLLTALTIPSDGKIMALDINREAYEIGLPVIQKAGVEHKINFVESEALPVLDKLLEDHENEGSFDFAYVDADKDNNLNYHERLLKLVKISGIIAYDNTLWRGTVAIPQEFVPESDKPGRKIMIEFNKFLAADPRIQICQASVGDGTTFCMRMY